MCLLILIRISATTLHGRQKKSCNFTEILKTQKLKNSRLPSSNNIFYYLAPLGFGIVEYNDRPIIEEIKSRGGWGCVSVPENGRKSRKMKFIVPGFSEKIMACMQVQDGDMHLSSSVLPCKMNKFQHNNAASVAMFNCLFHYCNKRY